MRIIRNTHRQWITVTLEEIASKTPGDSPLRQLLERTGTGSKQRPVTFQAYLRETTATNTTICGIRLRIDHYAWGSEAGVAGVGVSGVGSSGHDEGPPVRCKRAFYQ